MNTWSILVLAGLSTCALAEPYYVKGEFNAAGQMQDIYYPVDKCVRTSSLANYAKYTCLSVSSYKAEVYTACEGGCSCASPVTTTYTVDDAGQDFNCKGNSTHDYMATATRLGSCEVPAAFTVFAVVNHCQQVYDHTFTISHCDDSSLRQLLYMGGDGCTNVTYVNSTTIGTSECKLFMEVGALKIYTQLTECHIEDENYDDRTDASAVSSALLALVSAFSALLAL